MVTNYTTKTASLKAIKADIRKVTANTVYVDHTVEKDGAEVTESVDVVSLIKDAQESAAISVGRDSDKDFTVDTDAITSVKKINFLGKYVNVVPGANGVVNLYIGEDNSHHDVASKIFTTTPSNSSSAYVYADADNDFALPVTSGTQTKCYKNVSAGETFGTVSLVAKSVTDGDIFSLNSGDFIWVRLKYDTGDYGDWGKVALSVNRGNYNNGGNTPSASSFNSTVAFTADPNKGEAALPNGVTMNIGNYVLTAENDAQNGKVPGRCETKFTIKLNLDTIATKRGGKIGFQWAISKEAPSAPEGFEIFLTEHKTPNIEGITLGDITNATVSVSGITYRTKGTKVKFTTGDITNTQYKSATGLKRLGWTCAGNSGSASITTEGVGNMTLADGSVTATQSGATYTYSGEMELGEKGSGSAAIAVTAYGYNTGNTVNNSVSAFWGKPTDGILDTYEPWGTETHRYQEIACTNKWVATDDVTTKKVTIDGVETIGAVAQYGQLIHPSKASNAITIPTSYASSTSPASYIRKFTVSAANSSFTISATNIASSGIKVYWYNTKNGELVELTDRTNGNNVIASDNNSITHNIEAATENTTMEHVVVFVIPQNGNAIGKVTFA